MCLLFISTSEQVDQNDYLIVIASNRDEFFSRPSRCCHFWEKNPTIVGGMDFEEGREGGTWLAMNNQGKIASILNLAKPIDELTEIKSPRGFLVVNYLESQAGGEKYLRRLQKESDHYEDFLLVTLEVRPSLKNVSAYYYNNKENDPPFSLQYGVHVFGNSTPSSPWKKFDEAKKKFETILSKGKKKSRKEELINNLFEMLQDDTQYYPDEQLEKDSRGMTEESLKSMSAIFVKDPDQIFGSRTHTVILIDAAGNVDFVEKTMQEPIDFSTQVSWITTRLQFVIQDGSPLLSRL